MILVNPFQLKIFYDSVIPSPLGLEPHPTNPPRPQSLSGPHRCPGFLSILGVRAHRALRGRADADPGLRSGSARRGVPRGGGGRRGAAGGGCGAVPAVPLKAGGGGRDGRCRAERGRAGPHAPAGHVPALPAGSHRRVFPGAARRRAAAGSAGGPRRRQER